MFSLDTLGSQGFTDHLPAGCLNPSDAQFARPGYGFPTLIKNFANFLMKCERPVSAIYEERSVVDLAKKEWTFFCRRQCLSCLGPGVLPFVKAAAYFCRKWPKKNPAMWRDFSFICNRFYAFDSSSTPFRVKVIFPASLSSPASSTSPALMFMFRISSASGSSRYFWIALCSGRAPNCWS